MSLNKLDAPASENTVRVRMVDTTALMVLHAKTFIEPMLPGHERMNGTDVAFLIENLHLKKKALFDLGTRKDFWNLPPSIQNRFDRIAIGLKVPQDVKDVLLEKEISLDSVNDIIWSHSHWDHTGDTTLFPLTTNLVIGSEITTSRPGYPENPDSPLPDNLFHNRKITEISFPSKGKDGKNLTIGGLPAHDFYGDGSLYLLSTPGHAKGHLCALARTTPDTFILMGGDVCHFSGAMRPSKAIPMPDPIPSGVLDKDDTSFPTPCPASYFLDQHPRFQKEDLKPNSSPSTTPYYLLSTDPHTVYDTPDPETAQRTVDTLISSFDSAANVLVCLAHDTSLLQYLPTLNAQPDEDLNTWYDRGWKQACHWGWLNEVSRKGKPGREPIVDGWWRDGVRYETAKEMLDAGKGET